MQGLQGFRQGCIVHQTPGTYERVRLASTSYARLLTKVRASRRGVVELATAAPVRPTRSSALDGKGEGVDKGEGVKPAKGRARKATSRGSMSNKGKTGGRSGPAEDAPSITLAAYDDGSAVGLGAAVVEGIQRRKRRISGDTLPFGSAKLEAQYKKEAVREQLRQMVARPPSGDEVDSKEGAEVEARERKARRWPGDPSTTGASQSSNQLPDARQGEPAPKRRQRRRRRQQPPPAPAVTEKPDSAAETELAGAGVEIEAQGKAAARAKRTRRKRSDADRAAAWRAGGAGPPGPSGTNTPAAQLATNMRKLVASAKGERTKEDGKGERLSQAQEKALGVQSKELSRIEQTRARLGEERLRQQIADSAVKGVAAVSMEAEVSDHEVARALLMSPRQLKARVAAGQQARAMLVQCNLKLVVWTARKYQGGNHGLSLEDLIQEGMFGLMKGAEKFDPERGYRFSTYAFYWVRQGVAQAVQNQGRTIRVPVYLQELQGQIRKATVELAGDEGAVPSDAALAAKLGISESRVAEVNKWTMGTVSLDKVLEGIKSEGREISLSETIEANQEGGAGEELGRRMEDEVERDMLKMDLEDLLDTLLPRERYILRMRYGLDDNNFKSLRTISEALGVSEKTIWQYEKRGIRKLRHPQRASYLAEYLTKRERLANGLKEEEMELRPTVTASGDWLVPGSGEWAMSMDEPPPVRQVDSHVVE